MSYTFQTEEFLAVPRRLLKFFGIGTVKIGNELIFKEEIIFYFAFFNMLFIAGFEFMYMCMSLIGKIKFNLHVSYGFACALCSGQCAKCFC